MKKYSALTLMELIIVMVIMVILFLISVVSYRSLVDSFSINEVSLTIAQDIRGVQRAAMLLDREGDERWLHGIGIDFTDIEDREYHIFKWCSRFDFYDEREGVLTGEIPNLAFGGDPVNACLSSATRSSCPRGEGDNVDAIYVTETKSFAQYDNLDFEMIGSSILPQGVRYILFESVSGKAFFYNDSGCLLNYSVSAGELSLNATTELFQLKLEPMRGVGGGSDLADRKIVVTPVSGIVYFDIPD